MQRTASRSGCLLAVLLLAGAVAGCGGPVNEERFRETVDGMQAMVEATEAGDVAGGERAFNRVHPFFHDLDPALRQKERPLADELWANVLRIEFEYAGRKNPEKLVEEGRMTLLLLARVGEAFGWEGAE